MVLGTWFFISASLTLLAGCAGNFRAPADPLLGGDPLRPAGQTAAVPPGPLPPLPAPSSTASNAALASTPLQPLDGRHDLRIGGAAPPAGGLATASPATEFTPVASPRLGVVVNGPQNSQVTTYEQAQGHLKSLGVTWQRLETSGPQGEWQFSCSLPNAQNPSISRTYQAQGTDPLAAIQAVLEQIEHDRR